MDKYYCQSKITVIDDIPFNTNTLTISSCLNLKTISYIPPSVETLILFHLPSLKYLPVLPPTLRVLQISNAPSLRMNTLPSSLTHFTWDNCLEPYEIPPIPLTLVHLRITFDRMPKEYDFDSCSKQQIRIINSYFATEKAKKRMNIIGNELRLKAISPERVAKWLGSEEDPQWELLDSILGID